MGLFCWVLIHVVYTSRSLIGRYDVAVLRHNCVVDKSRFIPRTFYLPSALLLYGKRLICNLNKHQDFYWFLNDD